jgi:hypothetical protein
MHHNTGCGHYAVEPEQLFGFHSVATKLQQMWKGNSVAPSGHDDVEQQRQVLKSPSTQTVWARQHYFTPSDYNNNNLYYRDATDQNQYAAGQNRYVTQGYTPSWHSEHWYDARPDPVTGMRSNSLVGAGIQAGCATYPPSQSQTRMYSGCAVKPLFHGASESFSNQNDTGITSRYHDTLVQPSYLPSHSSQPRYAHSLSRNPEPMPTQTTPPHHTVHTYSSPSQGASMRPWSQSLAGHKSAPGDMYTMG